jgi:hypothetical protein
MTKTSGIKPRTIKEWCEGFDKLYSKSDRQRSSEELWIATMAHCSDMGVGIRKNNYNEIINSATHVFCWMCSYINHCSKTKDLIFNFKDSLCDIVFLKFPGECGYCNKIPCQCNPDEMDETKNKVAKYENLYSKAKPYMPVTHSLGDWMDKFRHFFGGRIHMMTLESIGFHFLEEAGEEMVDVRQLIQLRNVLNANIKGIDNTFLQKITTIEGLIQEYSNCISDSRLSKNKKGKPDIDYSSKDAVHIKARIVIAKMDFVIELADTFSWFCAILIKLQNIAKCNDIKDFDLERKLQEIYGKKGEDLRCSTCKKTVCDCVFFNK